jgi:aryl-alcohol dehydrogenase-like predicted oxidoreductase
LAACDDSLRRLGRDHIDLYYAHDDDKDTPLEESLAAFTELQQAGKIRFAAASNYTGARLLEAAQISKEQGLIQYSALQNHYNLLEREEYERDSVPALAELGIEGVAFFGLARGFLSGKYREGVEVESVRATGVTKYTNEHGWAVLAKLDRLANHHSVSLSAIALAWLRQQPSVAAPIASARTTEQLREIMTHVNLTAEELQSLTD